MSIKERKGGRAAIIGLGLMGRSIAACLMAAGHHVTGVAHNLENSAGVPERIRALLAEMGEEGLLQLPVDSVMERFRLTAELGDIAAAEIVIESITEDLKVKRELLQRVEQIISPMCIFATNTSAIPVSLLQEGAKHPERILGLHWDEPAHVTRFMEIIPGQATAPEYLDRAAELALEWGKEPSRLRKEIRGFITNRISYAMFREACYLVDSGVCTVEDVDRSLRNDVGWWIPFAGPFRYMDLMGIEGYGRVMRDLLPDLSSSSDVPRLMREVVESGGRGISNGRGFYQYTPEEAKAWEQKFIEFNYKIRRLTAEYSDILSAPKEKTTR
ncbi:MAG TPA: 3-hydroxyacyl-CoA dehydrogenase family protein [Acidobacteriaceae bacterium]|nr:3-hydroxyacyl-CoA dehydrogenase family protein [Acidobacteriaceae bacterium]